MTSNRPSGADTARGRCRALLLASDSLFATLFAPPAIVRLEASADWERYAAGDETHDCSAEFAIREVPFPDGVHVSVEMPDGARAQADVIVEDLLVVGLGGYVLVKHIHTPRRTAVEIVEESKPEGNVDERAAE